MLPDSGGLVVWIVVSTIGLWAAAQNWHLLRGDLRRAHQRHDWTALEISLVAQRVDDAWWAFLLFLLFVITGFLRLAAISGVLAMADVVARDVIGVGFFLVLLGFTMTAWRRRWLETRVREHAFPRADGVDG